MYSLPLAWYGKIKLLYHMSIRNLDHAKLFNSVPNKYRLPAKPIHHISLSLLHIY